MTLTAMEWIEKQIQDIRTAFARATNVEGALGTFGSKLLRWQPKTNAQFMLNVDGSFSDNDSTAGAGGVIRDRHETWIAGCAWKFLAASALEAEWKALAIGVQWARSKGYGKCEVQSDCEEIVKCLNANRSTSNGQPDNFEHFLMKIIDEGVGAIVHVFREQNQVADGLAKFIRIGNADWMEFSEPPPGCCNRVVFDQMGGCTQRCVLLDDT